MDRRAARPQPAAQALLFEDDDPPPYSLEAAQALHCWQWCGGWSPERWPLYATLHHVDDWDRLPLYLAAIRDELNAPLD